MKNLFFSISAIAMLVLAACNNSGYKTASALTNTGITKVNNTETVITSEFKPFDVMEVNLTVKDYATWKKAFDIDSLYRKANGLKLIVIGRNNDNPNNLLVALSADEVQKAKAFAAEPKLKDLMTKSGVISKPDFNYYHVIRFNADSKEKQWVLITHKVKNFDEWLKVFDAEGTATRASFGLVDVVLSRGVDDPNIVHIVFDINDMAKAKVRMKDPALKKIMMDAGVEGEPKIEFYTSAE